MGKKKPKKIKFKPKRVIANEFADNLRNRLTKSEKHFKKLLSKINIRHTSQKIIYKEKSFYIADFYIPEKRLCIEIDGGYHTTPEQIVKDTERDAYLLANGYATWRMTNEEANALTTDALLQRLAEFKNVVKGTIRILAPAEEKPTWYKGVKKYGNPRSKRSKQKSKPIKTGKHLDRLLENKRNREERQKAVTLLHKLSYTKL